MQYPTDIGAALFTQKRERTGGLIDIQLKPTDNLELDLSGFHSKLEAPNYNRNYLLWTTHFIGSGSGQAPDAGYRVNNNTLVNATFHRCTGHLLRRVRPDLAPGRERELQFRQSRRPPYGDRRPVVRSAQVGTSRARARRRPRMSRRRTRIWETAPATACMDWAADRASTLGSTNNTSPFAGGTPVAFGWIFGAEDVDVVDREDWAKLDGDVHHGRDPLDGSEIRGALGEAYRALSAPSARALRAGLIRRPIRRLSRATPRASRISAARSRRASGIGHPRSSPPTTVRPT